ncbi:MAG: ATP-dependent RNA helicase RhlB [Gammaproteobacteria bacterium]|nr:ATP-dependent RNA helicase RhlB [Gammaproteobacteria bacterium]MDH3888720.1 ATP-dependent RNA helicase RhlB [Gammaproteobacteria bacterium]MDH3933792.1 ATP-dependent RNA helicase RhlB [Gammaproteobacteria bacterium]
MSETHLTNIAYSSFSLPENLMQGIEDSGFTLCTPIQAETLPVALAGRDVSGQAQTGTGKTAAFLIAVYNHLLTHPAAENRKVNQPRALMLAPTRELAIQIHDDASVIGSHTGLKLGLAYGGTGYEEQRETIAAGVDILIGTPGRLIDYFKQHVFDLKMAQALVLDEADRMFDLGFIKDIRYLMRRCPPPEKRLGLLFSATLSHRVQELAYEHMNNPFLVDVEPEKVTADRVRQVLYHTANEEKIPLLVGLLRHGDPLRSIVFVNTKRNADRVWSYLEGNGFKCAVLSGDVPQKKRQRLLKEFQSGKLPVLIATDVAARGLHIPDVSHVFNYDLPQDAEDYVHRIGRTARVGKDGDAISFACENYVYSLPEIEKYIGHKIPVEAVPEECIVKLKPPVRIQRPPPRPGGGRGKSGSPGKGGGGGRHRHRSQQR